jgi:hypothetical protein
MMRAAETCISSNKLDSLSVQLSHTELVYSSTGRIKEKYILITDLRLNGRRIKMENLHTNRFNNMMKFCHNILAAYHLEKLKYKFENVKIIPNGGCHDAEHFCVEDDKSV